MAVTLRPESAKALALAWGFGWRIVAGVVLGYYLDRWMGTNPLWILVTTLGSFVASITELLRVSRDEAEHRAQEKGQDSAQ